MILLDKGSLTPKRKVPMETMSLQLRERDSTATITPVSMSGISTESWFMDDTNPGKGIVWQVRSIQTDYATNTPSITLEHVINKLKNRVMFGEHTAAEISGTPGATRCTAKQAIQYILRFQDDWVLGSFGYSDSNPYKFNGDTLYDALETVSNSLDDPWWSYDTTKYPFVLNINPRPDGTACKLLPGRNLNTITKTVDKSGMYTRFYPIGKDDLHISGDFVGKNSEKYGIICKVGTDTSLETEAELRAWASSNLNRHCEPTVTITADAMELADKTGESLDRLTLGRLCCIPLTEYDTEINERITELNYPDKIHQPEVVRVTMCNNRNDVTRIIAEVIKETARGGRGGARQQKEDHAWFEDTDEYVAMVAEKTGINELGEEETLTGLIRVEAGKITQIVSAVGANGEVTAASICLAIEKSGSKASISADHITLGTAQLSNILTIIGSAVGVTKPLICSSDLTVNSKGKINCYNINLAGSAPITLNATTMAKAIKDAEVSGNTLKLTKFNGDIVNFSKAISSWVMGWSNGNLTVQANPQGQTCSSNIYQGTPVWSGKDVSIPILAVNSANPMLEVSTGRSVVATYSGPEKSDIVTNRSGRYASEPGADVTLAAISQNGWYVISVTVLGTTKTYKINVNV